MMELRCFCNLEFVINYELRMTNIVPMNESRVRGPLSGVRTAGLHWNRPDAEHIMKFYGRAYAAHSDGEGGGLSGQVESKYLGLRAGQAAETDRPERPHRL